MNKKISESELKVMQALWDKSPMTSKELIEVVQQTYYADGQTIRTLLKRLIDKGVVRFEKDKVKSRLFYYYPVLTKEECDKFKNSNHLDLYYKGDLTLMFADFLEENELTDEEIQNLKELLDAKKLMQDTRNKIHRKNK